MCGRQFVGSKHRPEVPQRPVCGACGRKMYVYKHDPDSIRFRCAGYPKCRNYLKKIKEQRSSCYLHHVPGRIRIKTPHIKARPFLAQELEEKIRALPAIRLVSANALTGSILVHYDENGVNAGAIVDLVGRETGIDLWAAAHPDRYVDEALSKTGAMVGKTIGRAVLGLVIGELLEGTPLALLAAAI